MDIRNYAGGSFRRIDDSPCGGGRGVKERSFYEKIRAMRPGTENRAVTVLTGEQAGMHLLYEDRVCVWTSGQGETAAGDAGDAGAAGDAPQAVLTEEELLSLPARGTLVTGRGQRIYTELLSRAKKLVICGGGHVSMPIIRIGKMLDFQVTVLEDREKFGNRARKAGADTVLCGGYEALLRQIRSDGDTYFIIVTRAHKFDLDCLREILMKPAAYIGMMGSRRRVAMVMHTLRQEGFAQAVTEAVHAPIGLKIEAETPEEIAVAVLAEIIAVKNQSAQSFGFPEELLEKICRGNACPASEENVGRDEALVLATIIGRRGAAPRTTGTKMLIYGDGSTSGTIGGGCAEGWVTDTAQSMLRGEAAAFATERLDLKAMTEDEESMVCGGEIEVLLEKI